MAYESQPPYEEFTDAAAIAGSNLLALEQASRVVNMGALGVVAAGLIMCNDFYQTQRAIRNPLSRKESVQNPTMIADAPPIETIEGPEEFVTENQLRFRDWLLRRRANELRYRPRHLLH